MNERVNHKIIMTHSDSGHFENQTKIFQWNYSTHPPARERMNEQVSKRTSAAEHASEVGSE